MMRTLVNTVVFSTLARATDSYGVAVVGGGPAGILSAIALARRGNTVNLFEQLLDEPVDSSRRYNLLLSSRGINALERFGVDYKKKSVIVDKIVRHVNGKNKPDIVECQPSVSISRHDLLECLRSQAESSGVKMNKSIFYDVDLKNKLLHLNKGSFEFDLLVGADGTNSKLRSQLGTYDPRFSFKEEKDDRIFKTFHINKREMSHIRGYEEDWDNGFHVWQGPTSELICPPTIHGGVTGAYVSKTENFDLSSFSDIFDNMRVEKRRNLVQTPPRRQKYIYCSHVGLGDVILVGDAAHSMPASLGQGVNSALEDAVCLDRCLVIRLHVDEMVQTYNNSRIQDAHAVCEISKKEFGDGDRSKMMLYLGRSDISYSDILAFTSD